MSKVTDLQFSIASAMSLASTGVKMTHKYFTLNEYVTVKDSKVIFEDNVEVLLIDFIRTRTDLAEGWSVYPTEENIKLLDQILEENLRQSIILKNQHNEVLSYNPRNLDAL